MKKALVVLTTASLLLSACGAARRARVEKSRQLHALTIEDFYSFMGVSKGDTYAKAMELWGEPTKEELNEGTKLNFATAYYHGEDGERLFSLTYDKRDNTLNHIRLTGSKEVNFSSTQKFFKDRGINDIKTQLLGMHRDSILSIFGEPTRLKGSEYIYEGKGINVTFVCYDFGENRCEEIYVFWNYYYKPE